MNAPEETDSRAQVIDRLDALQVRLAGLASQPLPKALTRPDPSTGEQWEWGQAWGHIAEFVPFWTRQARAVAEAYRGEPIPYGRAPGSTDRTAAIEAGRGQDPAALWAQTRQAIDDLRDWLRALPAEAWNALGKPASGGVLSLQQIIDQVLVDHLAQHATQLEELIDSPTQRGGG